jgi:AmiR/NasT family two-component response regulator
VIAIGATTPEMVQAAVGAGCIACFSAPLDQERLLALIRDIAPIPALSASA